jgi:hypothetical protein
MIGPGKEVFEMVRRTFCGSPRRGVSQQAKKPFYINSKIILLKKNPGLKSNGHPISLSRLHPPVLGYESYEHHILPIG